MRSAGIDRLAPLVGEWHYTMYNCWFLDSLDTEVHGHTSITWLHDAFVVLRTTDADQKPSDVWVIGYSDPQDRYEMLYADQRGVARVFAASFDGTTMTFIREDPDFHQRMTVTVTDGGLHAAAEASDDQGATWRTDLEMRFTRTA